MSVPYAGLAMRGTVEGFYGPPWTQAERLAHLRFSARTGLNTYVFAPKDDPRHRADWRQPHPAPELDLLAALVEAAHGLGVRFIYAISPGLSMRFADDADHRALVAKARQLSDVGVVSFALFFDDVPADLTHPEDSERWPGAGAAHGEACRRFVAGLGLTEPLLVCPTDYAGTDESDYRRQFAATAPGDAVVAWTGNDIVVGTITREDVDRAAASYRRRLVLWDNFPVNDFDPARLFLGPLTGRTTDLDGSALDGVLANPMVWAAPSQIPLVSVADWARDPAAYDPAASADRALEVVAGAGADDLRPLVRACSSWPPGAVQDAELARAAAETLAAADGQAHFAGAATTAGGAASRAAAAAAGGAASHDAASGVVSASRDAAAVLTARLEKLSRACRTATEPEVLVTALRPWLNAGAAVAEAGLAAVRLLAARGSDAVPTLRDEARRALTEAEQHYANVLRSVIPPFVRDVLDRTAPPTPAPGGGRIPAPADPSAPAPGGAGTAAPAAPAGPAGPAGPWTPAPGPGGAPVALLVTGDRRTAGDEAVTELLERRGYSVRTTGMSGAGLVVVTRGAGPEAIAAVAGIAAPLLAWHGFGPLGLVTRGEVLIARDRLRIVDATDPLAAGLDGEVAVYRGPSKLTVGDPGPDARVVARTVDGGEHPAVFHYPAGSRLADGTLAPAPRIGVFLAADGLAPWLLTDAGRAIVTAAVDAIAVRG